jgi:hypothetical protein
MFKWKIWNCTPAAAHMVQILMENGADVSARGGEYGRAAVCSASHSTVQLLIQYGANISAQSGGYDKQLFRLLYMEVAFPLSDFLSRTGLMQVYCFLIIWFLRVLVQILSKKKIESCIFQELVIIHPVK